MHRYGIEEESWFEAARTGLERRGFKLRIQPRSIIIDKEARLPRIVGSAREFLEFSERQGLRVEPEAFEVADRYGDSKSDLTGRFTPSPFETPTADTVASPRRGEGAARRPEVNAVETRLEELRQEQERLAAERKAAQTLSSERDMLEKRCASLEQELMRLTTIVAEAEQQRDLYQMSASAAEERLRLYQAEEESLPGGRSGDRRFDQLRRFLARELHPDLAGSNVTERTVRETLFKRIWAKIEQLQ